MNEVYSQLGLNESDTEILNSIDSSIIDITQLLIKVHNHGFKKGFNETIKEVRNEIRKSDNSIFGLGDSLKVISDFENEWCK